jgi:glycosyltransferase involved in cell wall biosynthesis
MRDDFHIAVIIPALNEAETIGRVLDGLPDWVDLTIVADNGSTDGTPEIAAAHGARVVREPRRGYGAACQRGMGEIPSIDAPDSRIVAVFLDGDCSDDPGETADVVDPITKRGYDFVLGSRVDGKREKGALSIPQHFGSLLASMLMKVLYDADFQELGPFRAMSWDKLKALRMDDRDFGWTVQMQTRAARWDLRTLEVPVSYRNRAGGKSKVSGTVLGVWGASTTILYVIFKEAFDAEIVGFGRGPGSFTEMGKRMIKWLLTS